MRWFLKELNDTVTVTVAPEFNDADIPNYSVICITENLFGLKRLQEINEKCRAANVGFILSETLGAATYAFVDYNKHTIHDANGENTENFIVSSIEQKENPTVTVHEDHRHTYQDGDFVFFREANRNLRLQSFRLQAQAPHHQVLTIRPPGNCRGQESAKGSSIQEPGRRNQEPSRLHRTRIHGASRLQTLWPWRATSYRSLRHSQVQRR